MLSRIARFKTSVPKTLFKRSFKSTPPRNYHTNSSTPNAEIPKEGKLTQLWKKYGYTAVIVHLTLYSVTLMGIYIGMTEGWFKGKDAVDLLKTLHFDKLVDMDSMNPKTTGFALAWILTKFTEPIRLPLTFVITPLIAKYVTAFLKTLRK